MPKSSSFQRVQIYEENLDHLEQVRRLASFILDFLKYQEVIWLMNEFLYFVGRWRTLRGRWGRSERFLRESTIWRWDTDLLLKTGLHPLSFLHPLCSSLCFRACWRTMSFSRRSPSALPRSTRQKRKKLWCLSRCEKRPDPPTFVVEHVRPFTVFSSFRSTARAFIYIFIEAVQDKVHVCNSYCIYSSICVLFSVNILVGFYLEWVQDSSFNVLSCSFFIRGT